MLEGIQTAVAVGEELDDKLPSHEYYEYFGPDFTLHVTPSNMANQNSKRNLNNLRYATNFSLCLSLFQEHIQFGQ